MSSCFKSVAHILNDFPALSSFLTLAGNYFAHLPKSGDAHQKETLEEHILLVNQYFLQLVNEHRLEEIIDKLISDVAVESDNIDLGNYIKKLFVHSIVFHDFGKINERFQLDKMKNDLFRETALLQSPISSTHSALSAYIYLSKHLDEIALDHKFNPSLVTACIYLSYSIFKHHSKKYGDDCLYTTDFADFKARSDFDKVKEFLAKYLSEFGYVLNPNILSMIGKNDWLGNRKVLKTENSFSLYALCRLNFSLLTAADYLATNQYMNNSELKDFGVLHHDRIGEIYDFVSCKEWINEAEKKRNYNKEVFGKVQNYELTNPTERSGYNLNVLRTEMGIEVIRNIRKNFDKNLFYIEAPTGGGKTNLSALAAIELLKLNDGKYNKVFYVFPFTTLITQTYKSLKETLGLEDDEMVELHSNAGIKMSDESEDDIYGNEKLNYINHLFVNYPFTFLSHIRFFDILKTNEKETNYLLHRIVNSIVVIDELQSYNPQHWDKIIYFINQYADKFNIKFILMSATLPKLDKLNVIKDQVQDFVYLLPHAKDKYFNNPNFGGRVSFDFELFERIDLTLNEIADKLLTESQVYAGDDFGSAKPLGSVYTIIEFIFKRTASEFYEIIKQLHNNFFDEIFVLSGTILAHRRKHIINFLKNKTNRKKRILLITTQVVEAGVDIDMDLGFKDRSLIDSDEQLAGRINRNINKQNCKLFLFNYSDEKRIYGNDKRLQLTRKHINREQYRAILRTKDFDKLYDIVLEDRNALNDKEMLVNFTDYENHIKHLRFQSVHEKFKLIDQNNISCFVPVNVPVSVDDVTDGHKEMVFTRSELHFLNQYGVLPNEQNEIEGVAVFDVYLDLINNKREFVKHQTDKRILQGIISKFVFSLFANENVKRKLIEYSDQEKTKSEFGYQYIEYWRNFYTIETGMRDNDFYSNETQFL